MKRLRTRSLRKRLIVRLVIVQGLALLAGFVALLSIAWFYGLDGHVPDPKDAEIVSETISVRGDTLVFTPSSAFERLSREAPDLWFAAEDETGRRLVYGEVPEEYRGLIAHLNLLGFTSIRDYGTEDRFASHIRVFETGGVRVHVLVGSGRTIDVFTAILRTANRVLLFIFAVLAIATVIAIPLIVRREFLGVEAIARAAEKIDFDQQGKVLQTGNLPSEIAPLVHAFNAALKRLDDGYTRQKRFLAAAAHELKTPIAVLQTRIETSLSGPERSQLLLDVARLTTLAEQLLDTQRLEDSGSNLGRTDLVGLARQVTADLAPLAIARGYEIAFDSAIDRFDVLADPPALERALTNLIHNAIAHGGGSGQINIVVDKDGVVQVIDQGEGVAPEHQDAIFEPFVRLNTTNTGAGLGLSLVSDIVRLHKGKISVASSAQGGAIFRIILPPYQLGD